MVQTADFEAVFAIALAEMRGVARAPRLVAPLVDAALRIPASALARSLTSLDADIARIGLPRAGLARLAAYRAPAPSHPRFPRPEGPVIVVSNHPGLFDCLALFAAIDRDDLKTLAASRPLLAALPNLSARLAFIREGAQAGMALRGAVRHLASGGALLHFPAGAIEPDPASTPLGASPLGMWKPGLDPLLALASRVVPETRVVSALVSGVISPRARAIASSVARRRGATDAIVPLLQLTFPVFGDVDLAVAFGAPRDPAESDVVASLRADLERLALDTHRR